MDNAAFVQRIKTITGRVGFERANLLPVSVFPLRIYQIILLLLGISVAVSCIHRVAYFDDAWFAEQAYWLLQKGYVRSELFRGLNGWENRIYVFHKLFIYTEALIFSVLGISVASSKVIGLLFEVVGLILVWKYPQKILWEQRWLAALLYLGCGTLIRYGCLNRPETMCMAIGFASFFAFKYADKQPRCILWSALLAGMTALVHLNGMAYMIAGTAFVLIKYGWRWAIGYGLISGLILILYTADALLNGELPLLLAQFVNDPATQDGINLADKLAVMATYHQLFFHSENEAVLTVLALLSLLVFRRQIRGEKPVLIYTVLLIGSFWLIAKSNTDIYFLLFLPWLSLLVAELAIPGLAHQPRWAQQIGQVLLVGYLLVAEIRVAAVITENRTIPDIEEQNAHLATLMPEQHKTVIAPLSFFFGQMDTYRIRGLTYYQLLNEKGPALSLTQFFKRAKQDSIRYIVSNYGRDANYNIPAVAPARIGDYQRIYRDQWHSLYQYQPK